MDASITVRDFSGGLNTAVDESRLGSQFTASMSNVEVTDSHTIKSRAGYLAVTASPIRSGSVVKSLYRYYTKGGSRKWVALCGTGVFLATDASRTTYGSVEVETLSYRTWAVASRYSGGAAVLLDTGTYTLPVPYSTNIRAKWSGTSVRARVDSGAWQTFSNSSDIMFAGLAATNHGLDIENTEVRNNTSLRLAPIGSNNYRVRNRDVWSNLIGPTTISIAFYDPYGLPNTADGLVGIRQTVTNTVSGSTYEHAIANVGVRPATSQGLYVFHDGVNWTKTIVPRSGGWHTVEFDVSVLGVESRGDLTVTDVRLDSVSLLPFGSTLRTGSSTIVPSQDLLVRLCARCLYADINAPYKFFDELRCNDRLVDDFGFINSAWVVPSGYTMSADTDAVSSSTYSTTSQAFIDTLTYQATPAWTRVAGVSATADRLACATYNDRLYFGTRYNALRYYTATGTLGTITASGTAPAVDMAITKQNRLFTIGKQTDRGLLEYTAVDAPQDWTGGGALKPWGKDSGADATGLAKWNDAVFVFAQNRTRAFQIEGAATGWLNKELSDSIGCVAPDTVRTTPNSVMFLSAGGVRAYGLIPGIGDTDGSGFLNVSEAIAPYMKRINPLYAHKACAAFFDNKYYLSVPLDASTVNNVTFVYRMPEEGQSGSWTKYTYGFASMCVTRGDEAALYAGGYAGNLYRLEYGTSDNGDPISWHWRTPPLMDSKGYSFQRHFRRCHVGVRAMSLMPITITPYSDDVAGQPVTVDVDVSSDSKPVRFPLNARGRSLGVDFSSSGSEQSVTISELTLTYVLGRMR